MDPLASIENFVVVFFVSGAFHDSSARVRWISDVHQATQIRSSYGDTQAFKLV